MPEGHTLHRLAAELDAAFGGRRVRTSSPQGRFASSAALLDRTLMRGAEARGKHLFLRFSRDRWVHVHLGLYGKVHVGHGRAPQPWGAVRLRISTAGAYADLRGPNACRLVTTAEREGVLARLGPDPLGPDSGGGDVLAERATRSGVAAGVLLMRQDVLAGVGNVYRAEVLFRHGVHPATPGREVAPQTWASIWEDLVMLMREGVRTGRIDTVDHEHSPEVTGRAPREDAHGGEVYVYRRPGRPCLVCGAPVATQVLGARNVFWCPGCQPPGSPGKTRGTARQGTRAPESAGFADGLT